MPLINHTDPRNVTGLPAPDLQRIRDFMQGAIYSWSIGRPNDWFYVRDLVGGENTNWTDTPLIVLYNRHIAAGHTQDEAIEAAGKELGWIVKSLLIDEPTRWYEQDRSVRPRRYRWVRNYVPVAATPAGATT